jgi:phage/plasmid-like protein (TIGR03299 family)
MHLVETMAYAGERPWHGLGSKLAPQQPIETWRQQAGMDWQIEESEVRYITGSNSVGVINAFPEQKVLYRSDTKAPLAVVSKRFQVVQPGEILEFYRDLTACSGFELETAGVLRAGRKFWALARTGQSTSLKGRDRVDGYLLLATACDGTLATTAQFTSVRVVCNNTLQIAIGEAGGAIKVPHRSQFDPDAVKRQLGITVSAWDGFVARMKALCERPVDPDSVDELLRRVLTYTGPEGKRSVVNEQALANVRSLYDGGGRGALMASSRGTAWGLLNGITEYVDHHRRARSDDHRVDAAWFGQGAQIKHRAWDEAMKLVA